MSFWVPIANIKPSTLQRFCLTCKHLTFTSLLNLNSSFEISSDTSKSELVLAFKVFSALRISLYCYHRNYWEEAKVHNRELSLYEICCNILHCIYWIFFTFIKKMYWYLKWNGDTFNDLFRIFIFFFYFESYLYFFCFEN